MSKASDSAQVQAWVESGHAIPLQASVKGGYIHYEFVGGSFDGVKLRLYPPFTERLPLSWVGLEHPEYYVLGPPKNGRSKRLTYQLVDDG